MTNITIYDDTNKIIERICNKFDTTEAEVIDYLIDNICDEALAEVEECIKGIR